MIFYILRIVRYLEYSCFLFRGRGSQALAVVGYRVTTCYRLSRYVRWEEKDGGTGGREKSRGSNIVRDKRVMETGEKIVHTAANMRHLMV